MKKRAPLKLSFDYMDTAERRVLSLEDDGLFCLPVIGFDNYRKKWQQAALHVHEECLEITLCLRGDLEFETRSKTYPFKPGSIFVSVGAEGRPPLEVLPQRHEQVLAPVPHSGAGLPTSRIAAKGGPVTCS
jgi:hypothetical protein